VNFSLIAQADSSAINTPLTSWLVLAVAAVAAAASFRRSTRYAGRAQWLLFGIAASASAVSYAIGATGSATVAAWLQVLCAIAFTAGTALCVYAIDRSDLFDILLDTILVIGAAAVVCFRWAPVAFSVISGELALTAVERAVALITPIASVASVFFAAILLTEVRNAPALGIAAAALSFTLAGFPIVFDEGACCLAVNAFALAAAAGWAFVIYAALRKEPHLMPMAASDSGTSGVARIRHVIAPATAVLIAIILIDAGLRSPLRQATAIVLGLMGLILAVRVAQLLYVSRSRTRERQELAQNRALIEVSHSLAGTTDLDATLELVTQLACKLLTANAASLELLAPNGNTLQLKSATGLPRDVIGMEFPVNGSFTGWVVSCGDGRTANNLDSEPLLGPESRRILGHAPIASVPLRHRGATLGALSCIGKDSFGPSDLELLGALADQAAVAIENARLFEQVRALSLTDPLTGLANRRQLDRDLMREFAAARRGRRLVAVMFDLNAFKSYNDRHGHLAGDQVLRAFGEALAHETRTMNLAARYGGDEFLVLLADADRAGAVIFVDRVKVEFKRRASALPHGSLSVEAGIAEFAPDMVEPEDLLAAADRALYDRKASRSKV
jgi:diguanylate cyclase (GGDEF)-like protein